MVTGTEKAGPWASPNNSPVRESQRTCTGPGPKSRPLKVIRLPDGPLVWLAWPDEFSPGSSTCTVG